jgi:hypothetical protein
MIIFYPEEYKENAPKYGDVRFYPTKDKFAPINVDDNGLYDTFVLKVGHFDGEDVLNYGGHKELNGNIHYYTTSVDCRYESKNLGILIDKFKSVEDIWNEG